MATFVLIPGAGTDPRFWYPLASELRARAHSVVSVDPPCEDEAAGLAEYADAVVDAVGERTDLVLVAHCLGGFTAPLVCDRVPVDLMVLLNAMVPAPGETPGDWWANTGQDRARHDQAVHGTPFEEPWPLARWPDVPTRFLLCRDDRFFPAGFIRRVVRDRLGITPDEMPGGHCVPLSRPVELADRLEAYRGLVAAERHCKYLRSHETGSGVSR